MRTRHLLAAGALAVALQAFGGTASAAEVADCGTVDLLEQVVPAARGTDGTTSFLTGDALDRFELDDEAHTLDWAAREGASVDRIIVQAGRNTFVWDAPEAHLTIDSARAVESVTFCGTTAPTDSDEQVEVGVVELAAPISIEIGEALVIERSPEAIEDTESRDDQIDGGDLVEAVEELVAPDPAPEAHAAPVILASTPMEPVEVVVVADPLPATATEDASAPAPQPTSLSLPQALDRSSTPVAAALPATTPAPVELEDATLAATPATPTPLPVGTMEIVLLTCLGMITFSATARLPHATNRGRSAGARRRRNDTTATTAGRRAGDRRD